MFTFFTQEFYFAESVKIVVHMATSTSCLHLLFFCFCLCPTFYHWFVTENVITTLLPSSVQDVVVPPSETITVLIRPLDILFWGPGPQCLLVCFSVTVSPGSDYGSFLVSFAFLCSNSLMVSDYD